MDTNVLKTSFFSLLLMFTFFIVVDTVTFKIMKENITLEIFRRRNRRSVLFDVDQRLRESKCSGWFFFRQKGSFSLKSSINIVLFVILKQLPVLLHTLLTYDNLSPTKVRVRDLYNKWYALSFLIIINYTHIGTAYSNKTYLRDIS